MSTSGVYPQNGRDAEPFMRVTVSQFMPGDRHLSWHLWHSPVDVNVFGSVDRAWSNIARESAVSVSGAAGACVPSARAASSAAFDGALVGNAMDGAPVP